jgi:diguanylate cyclase (GGDEF)-like protein
MVAGEPETLVEHGFFFWIYAAVAYLSILISVGLFFNYYRVTPRLYRQQATLFALGAFIPLGGRILEDFLGLDLFPKIDNVILLLLISGILWAVAIFRYGGLDLAHIAHNLVIQNIKAGIIVLDMQGRVIEMNPYAQDLVGMQQAEVIGKPLQETLVSWAGLNNPEGEMSIQLAGEANHFSIQTSPIKDNDGRLAGHAIVLFDITAQKQAERQLERLARTDSLTQIINRRYFFELATAELTRAWRHDRPVAVLMFDIDHFKQVNDTYGHQAGDEALKLVAAQCQWELRATDIFARYGGEEFICMLVESTPEGAQATAERIRKLIESARPEFEGKVIPITLSIGVAAAAPIGSLTLEALITRADQALFEAKGAGRNCVKVWGE